MKTALISVLTATVLAFASRASGHAFNSADFIAILFTTGLVAWTLALYGRPTRALRITRPIHLPIPAPLRGRASESARLAA